MNAKGDGLVYQRLGYGTGTINASGFTDAMIAGIPLPYSFTPFVQITPPKANTGPFTITIAM
ncbi:hypothetical protein XS74_22930 [Salmonella enterica subsp. enterica]|nr:hypothetical protein [Salmonella enterica subsp. enterica]EDT7315843.1 hypothetical protein [Salmonella enterica subsp. enterica]